MTAKKLHYFVLWLSLLSWPFLATAQKTMGSNGLWTAVGEKSIPQVGTRYITPKSYKTFQLNLENLQKILDVAPMEFTPVAQMTKTYLELPMPDGSMKAFDIVESPIMAAELSARFPEINTYAGYAVDNKNIFVRFDLTPQGFHAMIMIPGSATILSTPTLLEEVTLKTISFITKKTMPLALTNILNVLLPKPTSIEVSTNNPI